MEGARNTHTAARAGALLVIKMSVNSEYDKNESSTPAISICLPLTRAKDPRERPRATLLAGHEEHVHVANELPINVRLAVHLGDAESLA